MQGNGSLNRKPTMYSLTLTAEEREAMDWIGHRYAHGNALSDILTECMAEWDEWDHEGDLTFMIPEHKAWEINDLLQGEDFELACLCGKFAEKLISFCFNIV